MKKYFQVLAFSALCAFAMFFTACQKEATSTSEPQAPQVQVEQLTGKYSKTLTVTDAGQKNKATLLISSNDEAMINSFDEKSFTIEPVFEELKADEVKPNDGKTAPAPSFVSTFVSVTVTESEHEPNAKGVEFSYIPKTDVQLRGAVNWWYYNTTGCTPGVLKYRSLGLSSTSTISATLYKSNTCTLNSYGRDSGKNVGAAATCRNLAINVTAANAPVRITSISY